MIGGAYLVYIGVQIWRGAKTPICVASETAADKNSLLRAFATSLLTQLSNPKAIVFYGSIFAALLPSVISPLLTVLLPLCVLAIEAGWYSVVALVLSSAGPRALYLRAKFWIDRTAGGLIGLLGVKLIAAGDVAG